MLEHDVVCNREILIVYLPRKILNSIDTLVSIIKNFSSQCVRHELSCVSSIQYFSTWFLSDLFDLV